MAITITHNVQLADYTTLQVGGAAEYFTDVYTEEDLQEAVLYAKDKDLNSTVLGGGSNVLIADDGIKGLVIHIAIQKKEATTDGEKVLLRAGGGEILDDVVAYSVQKGWWGIENLSHIPGTVGATPVQNVGAYGVEIENVIASVRTFDMQTCTFKTFTPKECAFGYRDSVFKKEGGRRYIVTEVVFTLSSTPRPHIQYKDLQALFGNVQPTITDIRNAVIAIRANKFPDWHVVGTAGSFFKNPIIASAKLEELRTIYPNIPSFALENNTYKVPLGWILEHILSYKGVRHGHVGTYVNQALVLINYGAATAEEITKFANEIVRNVKEVTGIEVEWEVTKL